MTDYKPLDTKHQVRLYENMTEKQRFACWYFLNALEQEFFHTYERIKAAGLIKGETPVTNMANYWHNNAMAMRLAKFRLGVTNKGVMEYAEESISEFEGIASGRGRTDATKTYPSGSFKPGIDGVDTDEIP